MGFTSLGEIVKNCFETKFTILVFVKPANFTAGWGLINSKKAYVSTLLLLTYIFRVP